MPAGPSRTAPSPAAPLPALVEPRAVLTSLRQASYRWCLDTDAMAWSANAQDVLGLAGEPVPPTGTAFAMLIEERAAAARLSGMLEDESGDPQAGVPFRLTYAMPARAGRPLLHVEETGRWFAGPDGTPTSARGLLRIVTGGSARDARSPGGRRPPGDEEALSFPHFFDRMRTAFSRRDGGSAGCAAVSVSPADRAAGRAADMEALAVRLRSHLRGEDVIGILHDGGLGIVLQRCNEARMAAVMDRIGRAAHEMGLLVHLHGHAASPRRTTAREVLRRLATALPDDRDAADDDVLAALNERRLGLALDPVAEAATGAPALHLCRLVLQGEGRGSVPSPALPALRHLLQDRLFDLAIAAADADPDLRLGVPVDVGLMETASAAAALALRLHCHPRAARRLTLCIHEEEAAAGLAATQRLVAMAKEAGARILIDGFGGGRIAAATLAGLGIDAVTIDGVFIGALSRCADGRFFVRTLIALADDLGLDTMAEWVDDDITRRQLQAWGCRHLAGTLASGGRVSDSGGPARSSVPAIRPGERAYGVRQRGISPSSR